MRRFLKTIYRWFRPAPIPMCDPETSAVLQAVLREDSNTIDIGCNRGSILREMIRLAPAGKHFAFEPIPDLFALLRRRFPNVDCRRMALSDEKGIVQFNHFADMDGFSGLRRRELDVDPGTVRQISVPTDRLDDVLPRDIMIHLIKIDVEGAELKALKGAEQLLRRCRPVVIFECGKGGLDIYGHTPEMIFAFLHECCLSIRRLNGWTPTQPPLPMQAFVEEFWKGQEYMFVASPDPS